MRILFQRKEKTKMEEEMVMQMRMDLQNRKSTVRAIDLQASINQLAYSGVLSYHIRRN